MPHQVLAALDGVGVAIGNDEEVVGNGGEGVVIMVRDDDPVVPAPLPDKRCSVIPSGISRPLPQKVFRVMEIIEKL